MSAACCARRAQGGAGKAGGHGEITADAFKAIEDREIEAVIRKQEAVRLNAVTDGEYRRISWNTDFLEQLHNVKSYVGERRIKFQGPKARSRGRSCCGVIGKLGDYTAASDGRTFQVSQRASTKRTPKMTIPSPSSLHFRYGRDAVPERIYPSMDDFYRDLGQVLSQDHLRAFADAGCRYLQLDEVNLTYLCDPSLRQVIKRSSDNQATLPATYARMINAAISDIPSDMTITMHLCRGNFRSNFVASGGYEPVAESDVQRHQCERLFHGIRHRKAGRVRTATLCPQGQDRRARARHQARPACWRIKTPSGTHRRSDEIRRAGPALPVAAMRLRLHRGGQCFGRRRRMGEAAHDRGIGG